MSSSQLTIFQAPPLSWRIAYVVSEDDHEIERTFGNEKAAYDFWDHLTKKGRPILEARMSLHLNYNLMEFKRS